MIGDNCGLLIDTNENFWALGMVVQRGYYVTYDVGANQIGFAPLLNSKKIKITNLPVAAKTVDNLTFSGSTTTTTSDSIPVWESVLIGIVVGASLIAIAVVVGLHLTGKLTK